MNSNHSGAGQKSLLNRADKIGSVLSSICAVHCLCMPVLLGLLPIIGLTFLASHTFERTACVAMTILAAICLWCGCRVHRRWGLLALLGFGVALVLYTQFAGAPDNDEHENWREAAVMAAGGALIAASHLLNLKLRARCGCGECCGKNSKTENHQ